LILIGIEREKLEKSAFNVQAGALKNRYKLKK
jgi:hypothetical protein